MVDGAEVGRGTDDAPTGGGTVRDLKMKPVESSPIKLSVVIRCRDGATGLDQVFGALHAQSCDFAYETIVVATAAVGVQPGAQLITLAADQFTDGRAANLGIRQARGELVLLMNADTVLIGSGFFDQAVAPFQDPQMAGARCLLVANAAQLIRWNKPHDIQYASPE